MYSKYKIFLPLFLYSFFPSCTNKSDAISKRSLSQVEIFFDKIKNGNYQAALNELLLSNKDIDFTDSTTTALKKQFNDINEYSGKYIGYKLLRKRIVADDIAVYSYLVKFKKKFYRFIFIFYNTDDDVKIYKFAYDDAMDAELEESLRLYTE